MRLAVCVCLWLVVGVLFGQEAPRPRPMEREADRIPERLDVPTVSITLGQIVGTIRPLLGVNAGPVPSGEGGNADVTSQYRWAGIREVRTHDFYGPLDLSVIYPDINADPKNPDSFNYVESDKVFSKIIQAGIEPYFRLGDSYNNVRIPSNAREMDRYVQAGVAVTKHYAQDFPRGEYDQGVRCVEICNEPDNKQFWPAPYETFFPYFANTFKEIKRGMPELKVGGPGFVVASYKVPALRKNVTRFLDYLKTSGIRPDFISFHLYSNDPAEYFDVVRFYREEIKKRGMSKAELHVSEWNTEKDNLPFRVGRKAAPYATACWIALQQAEVDRAYVYRGTDTNPDNPGFYGIFFAQGEKKPVAYAFHLWNLMAKYPNRLVVSTGHKVLDATPEPNHPLKPLWVLAGQDEVGNVGILLSNIGQQPIMYTLPTVDNSKVLEILEFSDPRGGLASKQFKSDGQHLLPPLSVQWISIRTP